MVRSWPRSVGRKGFTASESDPSRKPQKSLSRSLGTGTAARLKQRSGSTVLFITRTTFQGATSHSGPISHQSRWCHSMFTGQFDEGSTSAEVSSSLLSKLAAEINPHLAIFTVGHSWGSFVWILVHINGFFIKAFSFTVSAILDPALPALLLQLKHVNVDAPGKVRTGLRKKAGGIAWWLHDHCRRPEISFQHHVGQLTAAGYSAYEGYDICSLCGHLHLCFLYMCTKFKIIKIRRKHVRSSKVNRNVYWVLREGCGGRSWSIINQTKSI